MKMSDVHIIITIIIVIIIIIIIIIQTYNLLVLLGSVCLTTNHEVEGSIPNTSTILIVYYIC